MDSSSSSFRRTHMLVTICQEFYCTACVGGHWWTAKDKNRCHIKRDTITIFKFLEQIIHRKRAIYGGTAELHDYSIFLDVNIHQTLMKDIDPRVKEICLEAKNKRNAYKACERSFGDPSSDFDCQSVSTELTDEIDEEDYVIPSVPSSRESDSGNESLASPDYLPMHGGWDPQQPSSGLSLPFLHPHSSNHTLADDGTRYANPMDQLHSRLSAGCGQPCTLVSVEPLTMNPPCVQPPPVPPRCLPPPCFMMKNTSLTDIIKVLKQKQEADDYFALVKTESQLDTPYIIVHLKFSNMYKLVNRAVCKQTGTNKLYIHRQGPRFATINCLLQYYARNATNDGFYLKNQLTTIGDPYGTTTSSSSSSTLTPSSGKQTTSVPHGHRRR